MAVLYFYYVFIFEPEKYDARQNLYFLRSFVKELTLPVCKDGRKHVDYVPTKIISEYFRFKTENENHIFGLRYRSVKKHDDINVVIFDSDNLSLQDLFGLKSIEKMAYKLFKNDSQRMAFLLYVAFVFYV